MLSSALSSTSPKPKTTARTTELNMIIPSLRTSDLRLALVSWRTELLSLAKQYPDLYPEDDFNLRIADLDAALLAIDTSKFVGLFPSK